MKSGPSRSNCSDLHPRNWFQFSIRSLLTLTFLTAAVLAYWVRPALSQRAALAALRGHYTDVTYDVPCDPATGQPQPRFVPRSIVRWLGIDFVANITGLEVYNPTDDALRRLGRLPHLRSLTLHGTDFTTEAGARSLQRLSRLQTLVLAGPETTRDARDRFQRALPACIIICRGCEQPATPTPRPDSMPLAYLPF